MDGCLELFILWLGTFTQGEVPKWARWGVRKTQFCAVERQNMDVLAGYRLPWMVAWNYLFCG